MHAVNQSPSRTRLRPALAALGLFALLAGCLVQRPLIPQQYYGFRGALQVAITDTAMVVMAGRDSMQARLQQRLTELSSLVVVDSVVATLYADDRLSRLGGAVRRTVTEVLDSGEFGGSVREAYLNPDGQRLAVDAVVVGLGRALHLLRDPPKRTGSRG